MDAQSSPRIKVLVIDWKCYLGLLAIGVLTSCGSLQPNPHAVLGSKAPAVQTKEFKEQFAKVGKSQWLDGNKVETLTNGNSFFPRMLAAVKAAKKTIVFESFVVVDSQDTYELVMALSERSKAGVKVHVILDAVGCRKLDKRYIQAMREAGVEVELYRPFNYFRPLWSNHRDHRKILVVDGKVGFTGGAGHAHAWRGDARNESEWRDTQYEVRGPVVADLQRGFINNWKELTGRELSGEAYFPRLGKAGSMEAVSILGAPLEQGDTIGSTYLAAIDAAKSSILIEHAYFLPPKDLREAMKRACARGVEVEVILPGYKIDAKYVLIGSKLMWKELLRAGVKIYIYEPSMMHGKLMVVDDKLSIIGSGNFDPRSMFTNDELNLAVLDKAFAREQRAMFESDKLRCKKAIEEDAEVSFWALPWQWSAWLAMPLL